MYWALKHFLPSHVLHKDSNSTVLVDVTNYKKNNLGKAEFFKCNKHGLPRSRHSVHYLCKICSVDVQTGSAKEHGKSALFLHVGNAT